MTVAYCYRSGQIRVGKRTPKGAVAIARGPYRKLRDLIHVTSRHSYDGKTMLVPGLPEAPDDDAAVAAVKRYGDWLREHSSYGCRVLVGT
jgi:hypothetical protein